MENTILALAIGEVFDESSNEFMKSVEPQHGHVFSQKFNKKILRIIRIRTNPFRLFYIERHVLVNMLSIFAIMATVILLGVLNFQHIGQHGSDSSEPEQPIPTVCEDIVWGTQYLYCNTFMPTTDDSEYKQAFLMRYAYKGTQPEIELVGLKGTNVDKIVCTISPVEYDHYKDTDVYGYKCGAFEVVISSCKVETDIRIDSIILNIDGKEQTVKFVNPIVYHCISTDDNFAHAQSGIMAGGCEYYEVSIISDRDATVSDYSMGTSNIRINTISKSSDMDNAAYTPNISVKANEKTKLYLTMSSTDTYPEIVYTRCCFSATVTDGDGNTNIVYTSYLIFNTSPEQTSAYLEAILRDGGRIK